MNIEEIKQAKLKAFEAIDMAREEIISFGKDILEHPELGFKEKRTSEKLEEALKKAGIQEISHHAVTGLKGWLKKGEGPTTAVIGELDAVLSPEHPCACPETGAAHACRHNAQLSGILGCAVGLKAVADKLSGSICFMATPAEEYVEVSWRADLRKQGKLQYLGGKQQLIAEGAFDDVDLAMIVHSETNAPQPRVVVNGSASGFIGKNIHFYGKEAHAGGAPWEGINALNAAVLAMTAINSNRETFKDSDNVRVHPIITKGGDIVNTVPAHVEMESYVRGANIEAIQDANAKVNRAVQGSAYAIGAKAQIDDLPGYLPLKQNGYMSELFAANAGEFFPEYKVERGLPFCGSTDMGDLSYMMPVIQPTISGFTGTAHSKDFTICDEDAAYIMPAKLMTATVIDLMTNDCIQAQSIISAFPGHSKYEYRELWKNIMDERK